MTTKPDDSLSIIFITDQKAGHLSQLRGLEERLSAKRKIDLKFLTLDEAKRRLKQALNVAQNFESTKFSDIVIGAGHKTHKYVLRWAKRQNAMSCVLMTPHGAHKSQFDAIISPMHDQNPERAHILQTHGVINNITPPSKSSSIANKKLSLMLLGGRSKHYHWSTSNLLRQISEIRDHQPDTHWHLFTSRRTPRHFLERLAKQQNEHLTIHTPKAAQPNELSSFLQQAGYVWVTPDSGSMMYEALTAEASVACFALKRKSSLAMHPKGTKISRDVEHLIGKGFITQYQDWISTKQLEPNKLHLWEADKAANWLLERYDKLFKQQSLKPSQPTQKTSDE